MNHQTALSPQCTPYALHGVALASELFIASGQFLAQRLIRASAPMLCRVPLPAHGYPNGVVWIGRDDAYLGSGLYVFRDLTHYRDWLGVMHGVLDWEPHDDQSLLALTFEHWRWLEVAQQREIRRLGLPLHPPGLSPIVLTTDSGGERRPHRAVDLECVVLVARAIAQAAAIERDGEQTVSLCGVTHAIDVRLRHPEASEADVNLCLKYCDETLLAEMRLWDEQDRCGS